MMTNPQGLAVNKPPVVNLNSETKTTRLHIV